jgi:helix-turn-helix protein
MIDDGDAQGGTSLASCMTGGTMNVEDQNSLLLPREVAAMLRLKVNSVYAAASAGKLPAVRLWRGRRKSLLRFRRAEIEALIRGENGPATTPSAR